MKVPDLIAKAHLSLPWDERDLYWEVMLTPNMAWTNTHIDKGDRGDVLVRIGGTAEGCPVVKIYDAPVNPQRTLDCFPPTGQPVWMIKGRKFDIVRTMRTSAPGSDGTFHFVTTVGDGPYPGQPQPGDSGSVCWTVINGVAKIVGLVVSARQISLPFWTKTLTGTAEGLPQFVVPPRYRPQQPDQLPAMDFSFGLPMIAVPPEPSELQQQQPQPQPQLQPQSMNRHSVIISNVATLVHTVVITGVKGDRWERPSNPAGYWPVDIVETPDGAVLSWDVSQTQGANYTVMVVFGDGSSLTRTGVSSGDVLEWRPPTSPDVPTPQPDSVAYLQARIAKLEQALASEHDKVSALTSELERLNDIKYSIDRLGKAMGWSR